MPVGLGEHLPAGFLLSTVEKAAGYARSRSMWSAFFGMEKTGATPREADLMIVAGRESQKMAPVMRQIYDQMPEPKWVIAMGACVSSDGMFNNYAVVQGAGRIVPGDIYLPRCPPRPEMLLDAILKLHDKVRRTRLGAIRDREITELEHAMLRRPPLHHPRTAPSWPPRASVEQTLTGIWVNHQTCLLAAPENIDSASTGYPCARGFGCSVGRLRQSHSPSLASIRRRAWPAHEPELTRNPGKALT